MTDSKHRLAELNPVSSDPLELRAAFGCFPSGVTAVCAIGDDGKPVGMAASSFVSVSVDPPLVGICIQQTSTSWPRLRGVARLGLSVLAQGQEHACLRLSGKGDRFSAIEWLPTDDGAVFVPGASVWLDCSIFKEVGAGDHSIIMLQIHRLHTDAGVAPLVFHGSQFRRLEAVAPSAPPTSE
ncbi:MAG: flavin reductase domain protein FMN-binding protein [Mycobacterium sp.]|nr:flavin reductase domain protein FMN-binding protein [Mycobacterium sp.]